MAPEYNSWHILDFLLISKSENVIEQNLSY